MTDHEGTPYRVLSPTGRHVTSAIAGSAPVTDLSGLTICEVWDGLFRGDLMFESLRRELSARAPGLRFVGHEVFGDTHGAEMSDVESGLPRLLREQGCQVVLSAVGA